MATNEPIKSLARHTLNQIELKVLEQLLYAQAEIIDALMVDGIPYTKLYLSGGQPSQIAPPGGE